MIEHAVTEGSVLKDLSERSTDVEPTFVASNQKIGVRFGAFGRWLLNNHLDTIRARKDFDREVQQNPVAKGAEAVLVTGLESIPWVGDGVTVLEAIRGKTLDDMPLSAVERALYIFFSIPAPPMPIDLPARPAVALYHALDTNLFTPILLGILGPEAEKEDQQAQAAEASYMLRRDTPHPLVLARQVGPVLRT